MTIFVKQSTNQSTDLGCLLPFHPLHYFIPLNFRVICLGIIGYWRDPDLCSKDDRRLVWSLTAGIRIALLEILPTRGFLIKIIVFSFDLLNTRAAIRFRLVSGNFRANLQY
jgi:hypothetical protein